MANNTPKSSNKPRESLRNIPDDLFDPDINIKVKAELIQKQYKKDPLALVTLIKRMIR